MDVAPHQNTTDEAPASTPRIGDDLACFGCGYNLRTLSADAACPECGQAVAETVEAQRRGLKNGGGFAVMTRVVMVLFGWVLPFICFLLTSQDNFFIHARSGRWSEYVMLPLGGPVSWAFYPALFFAAVALGVVTFRPRSAHHQQWVLVGLGLGVLVGAQYTLVMAVALGDLMNELQPLMFRGSGNAIGLGVGMVILAVVFGSRWLGHDRSGKPAGSRKPDSDMTATVDSGGNTSWAIALGSMALACVITIGFMLLVILVSSPLLYLLVYHEAVWRVLQLRKLSGRSAEQERGAWPWGLFAGVIYVLTLAGAVAMALRFTLL